MIEGEQVRNLGNLSVTVSVQFTVGCREIDTDSLAQHRILVHRNGVVTCPDHVSSAEAVMEALGGRVDTTCSYWQAVGDSRPFPSDYLLPPPMSPPELLTWRFDNVVTSWTNQARTTAVAAILGRTYGGSLDPEKVLPLQKVFIKNNQLASDSKTLITQLLTPQERASGYRRSRATTPEELNELLMLGLRPRTAVDLACLDFDGVTVRKALKEISRLRIPADMITHLGQVFTPTKTSEILTKLDKETAALQVSKLAEILDPTLQYDLEEAAEEIADPKKESLKTLEKL